MQAFCLFFALFLAFIIPYLVAFCTVYRMIGIVQVLLINEIPYFVPVTSYSRPQQDLLLLRDKKNNKILGSIRFNYMIPVPMKCLHKLNIAELSTAQSRAHASKELAFCRRNRDRIYKTANTYMRVFSGKYPELTKNSCDFRLLEKAYILYS